MLQELILQELGHIFKSKHIKFIKIILIILLINSCKGVESDIKSFDKIDNINFTKSEDIIAKINSNEPVNYSGVCIKGDLDFSDKGKRVKNIIRITNSIICGQVNFERSIFDNSTDFSNTIFKNKTTFEGAHFNKTTFFRGVEFEKDSDFSSCNFRSKILFDETRFNGPARFIGSNFFSRAWFTKVQFNDEAKFDFSRFDDDSSFFQALFRGESLFRGTHFLKSINFGEAQFRGKAYFDNVAFEGDFSLEEAQFEEDVLIRDSRISGDILLNDTRLNVIHFANNEYEPMSKIVLNGSRFLNLKAYWSSIRDNLVFNTEVFNDLIRNYNDLGWFNDADSCYYDLRNNLRNSSRGFSKIADYFSLFIWGYGVKPSYPLIISLFFIFIFGLYFWGAKSLRKKGIRRISFIEALYYSAFLFIAQSPTEFEVLRRSARVAILIEGILGWALLAIFFGTVGHVMR